MDPLFLIVIGVGAGLSMLAQLWVKSSVGKWQRVASRRGLTGRDIAEAILREEGINDVVVEPVNGFLTDHYHPGIKRLRLSTGNFAGTSIAAAGIAAHEVGHAIQHARGYKPMFWRQRMVPITNISNQLSMIIIMAAAALGSLGLMKIGAFVFTGFVLFTIVTLPVEFDASRRALASLNRMNLLSEAEMRGARRVLTAAAATYVAAAVASIIKLLYFLLRAGVLRRR